MSEQSWDLVALGWPWWCDLLEMEAEVLLLNGVKGMFGRSHEPWAGVWVVIVHLW